jgi:hypothetical protein
MSQRFRFTCAFGKPCDAWHRGQIRIVFLDATSGKGLTNMYVDLYLQNNYRQQASYTRKGCRIAVCMSFVFAMPLITNVKVAEIVVIWLRACSGGGYQLRNEVGHGLAANIVNLCISFTLKATGNEPLARGQIIDLVREFSFGRTSSTKAGQWTRDRLGQRANDSVKSKKGRVESRTEGIVESVAGSGLQPGRYQRRAENGQTQESQTSF